MTVSASGTSTVDYYSVDRVGNREAARSYLVGIDTTAPATRANLYYAPNKWSLSSSDGVYEQSGGINAIYYSFDGGPYSAIRSSNPSPAYTTLYNVVTGPITWGTHTLTYYAVDNVGNVEATQTLSYPVYDSGAPTVRLETTGMSSARIFATDVTPIASGVKSISYRWGGYGAWSTATFSASSSPTSTQVAELPEGRGYFQYYATDFAGNSTATQSTNLTVDRTAPVVTITPGTTNDDGSVNVRLAATETGSGLYMLSYSILHEGSTSSGYFYSAPVDMRIAAPSWGSTTTVVSASARDNAGNAGAVISREIVTTNTVPDLLPPESYSSVGEGSVNTAADGMFELWIGASDDRSGVAETHYQIDGGEWRVAVPDPAVGGFPRPSTALGSTP